LICCIAFERTLNKLFVTFI